MRSVYLLLFVSTITGSFGQQQGFPFGQATYKELELKKYEIDTSAVALVLNEYGEAYIQDGEDYNLIFEYHVRIKILKQDGIDEATIEIPLRKGETSKEKLNAYKASAFNIENGSLRETKLDSKNVFQENTNKSWDIVKLAIPNVRVGSVIDYQYTIESPFIYNFRSWFFQDENPKLKSKYVAKVPANYNYNVTLRGFLKLSNYETKLIKSCFYKGQADCSELNFEMVDIPAFVEEEHMTAKSNFISAVNFELSDIRYFDGRVTRYTEEWKDADLKMQRHEDFGIQLRKAKDVLKDEVDALLRMEGDSLAKAKRVFDFVKFRYQWNGRNSAFTNVGIKKAYEERKGNVAEINLSLTAALRLAGLNADPVILSTRENGLPIEIHPVLSDFNYVITKVNLSGKTFLLDATDDYFPFGSIPIDCINGKGRVMDEKGSFWLELKPTDKAKEISSYTFTLTETGTLKGLIQHQYTGYSAIEKRKEIASFSNEEEYISKLKAKRSTLGISKVEIVNAEDITKPLIEKIEIEIESYIDLKAGHFLFNPFIEGKDRNPFKSNERLYPVDFGAPVEETIIFNLEYPANFELAGTPDKVALSLPNSGGRYLFGVQNVGNKIIMNNSLSINRTVYTSDEYHYLKELYNRVVQVQESDWVFKRKI